MVDVSIYTPEFFVGRSETVTASAQVVVPVVCEILQPESVLDLGCGLGEWLDAFPVEDKLGVDIAVEVPSVAHYHIAHDLTTPLDLGRSYDLVISLETAEHLPESAADTLVTSIVRHAGSVLFSAAVPGQEGKGHINCQPHDYWHAKFRAHGYAPHDLIRPRIARDSRVSPWYRDNIFVYLRDR